MRDFWAALWDYVREASLLWWGLFGVILGGYDVYAHLEKAGSVAQLPRAVYLVAAAVMVIIAPFLAYRKQWDRRRDVEEQTLEQGRKRDLKYRQHVARFRASELANPTSAPVNQVNEGKKLWETVISDARRSRDPKAVELAHEIYETLEGVYRQYWGSTALYQHVRKEMLADIRSLSPD